MRASEVARACAGRIVASGEQDLEFSRLTTDSRAAGPGDLFLALEGERFDGNDFIDDAISRGAALVVCSAGRAPSRCGVTFIECGGTLRALGDIAAAHRRCFDLPVVAVTGSNGKTTTKELLRAIIIADSGSQAHVLANDGNLNNLIGMPLTLMRLGSEHRVAVLEMGMNAPGEIARLAEIAAPTHAIITNVGAAHLAGLGSMQGVARAKGELFEALSAQAIALVNLDDAYLVEQAKRLRAKRFDYAGDSAVRAENLVAAGVNSVCFELVHAHGRVSVELHLGGCHNVANALAAAACALALGIAPETIAAGLATAEPPPMRLEAQTLANGVEVINDAYNANPSSVAAALSTLAGVEGGRAIVVLGEMLELGDAARELHGEAGAAVALVEPVLLCALGAYADDVCAGALEGGMSGSSMYCASDHDDAATAVARVWRRGDRVLVKGSRGAHMERVVEALGGLAAS